MTYTGTPTRYQEPPLARTSRGVVEGRWRWWYSAIADAMIAHPDWKLQEIAANLNKHPNTLGLIIGTDMFREYLAQRKAAWRDDHDLALRSRITEVATIGLDIVLDQLKTKRTQIPFNAALKVVESSLDRLGYAPSSGPQVVVNNSPDNRQQTLVTVTPADLEEARVAMRMAEQSRAGSSLAPPPHGPQPMVDALGTCEVGQDTASGVEVLDAEIVS